MKYCGVILLVVFGCGLACKETDLIIVEGMAVVANELRKGIKNIMHEFGSFNETLLTFNGTVAESLVNYSDNHCLQKFLVDFGESFSGYNCSEFKIKLFDIENDYYKAIEGEIVNKTVEIEKLAMEQKLNGSCYLENFGIHFSDLTYYLVYQINDSMRIVQEELNRKLNLTSTSLRIIGSEIKSEILKCSLHDFTEFCIAQYVSLMT
ncbi:unnamed protein product [Diamesa tonsa]